MTDSLVSVAIVGMGEMGRGWAALCTAAGWPVAVYDSEGQALNDAPQEVASRARRLVPLNMAEPDAVEAGIESIRAGRSLLDACRDAEWIIEAVREDLRTKQRVFKAIESVAPNARLLTSSSSGLSPRDIAARCAHQDRCLIAHPLNPPELIPVVELVPSAETDPALLELLKGWLRALRRIPVTVKKHVLGNVVNRISAAVWRESIDLVLKGVIDVEDLDRAVALGPALGWAAAGPHLTYHLAAGQRGVEGFLQQLLRTFEDIWADLGCWSHLEVEQQRRLIHAIEKTYLGKIDELQHSRDERLAAILRGEEKVRRTLTELRAVQDIE